MFPTQPPSMLSCIPPIMLSTTLTGMLLCTVAIALDGTLPVCQAVCSQASYNTLPSTPQSMLFSTHPSCSRIHSQALSQVHSQVCPYLCSQLQSMAHSQPTWFYALKYMHQMQDTPNPNSLYDAINAPAVLYLDTGSGAGARHLEIWGRWYVASRGWRLVASSGWLVTIHLWPEGGGICWPKSWCSLI